MKVSAAHLGAFIGAFEDCGCYGGSVLIGTLAGRPVLVVRGNLSDPERHIVPVFVHIKIHFDPAHGIIPAMYPASMVRAHVAAALNREATRDCP